MRQVNLDDIHIPAIDGPRAILQKPVKVAKSTICRTIYEGVSKTTTPIKQPNKTMLDEEEIDLQKYASKLIHFRKWVGSEQEINNIILSTELI